MSRAGLPPVMLTVLMLFSCGQGGNSAKQEISLSAGTISFTDDDGRTVVLEKSCSRIISLYSAHTENLFAIGAGAALAGVQKGADYPPEASALPQYDYNGDPEYIIAAAPDLVLIRPFVRRQNPASIAELEKAGLRVVSLFPESLDDFDRYISRLGLIAGRETGEELLRFHRELDSVAERAGTIGERKTIFFEATENELRTASAGSLPSRAIAFAGGLNVAAGAPPLARGSSIARFGAENLLSHAGEIDVYVVQQGAMNRVAGFAALAARPGFSAIRAVREGKVLFINEKLLSSPTFRYLEGVRILAEFCYPEIFGPADTGAFSGTVPGGEP